jgi:hypothetical protein
MDNLDGFQKLIYFWCCDDSGKNILYKKSGNERYPGFKLYKMIARTVHNKLPLSHLSMPFFKKFKSSPSSSKKSHTIVISYDDIPVYA